MYFVHSYYALPSCESNILTESTYSDFKFCSSVKKDNIYGFQFHPEKSGKDGLNVYNNFLKI
jgi:glutamine amidotransferase